MTKKRSPQKKRSATRKTGSSVLPGKRFIKAFTVSTVAAFSIVSCALNPQWHDDVRLDPLLAQLGASLRDPSAQTQATFSGGLQTSFRGCPQFFPENRAPVVPAAPKLRELCFTSFAILHNGQSKTPVFVAQRVNRQMLVRAQGLRRSDRFYPEARLPAAERAELDDYRGSGYSRGHMAPAADMHTKEAMAQSFSLANIVPQNQKQNSGPWSEIEAATRKYVMRAKGDVYIFTGPVYVDRREMIGARRVAVPSHFYKLVYDGTTNKSWVHWQDNQSNAKAGPPISYKEFEQRTGLRLLPE